MNLLLTNHYLPESSYEDGTVDKSNKGEDQTAKQYIFASVTNGTDCSQ